MNQPENKNISILIELERSRTIELTSTTNIIIINMILGILEDELYSKKVKLKVTDDIMEVINTLKIKLDKKNEKPIDLLEIGINFLQKKLGVTLNIENLEGYKQRYVVFRILKLKGYYKTAFRILFNDFNVTEYELSIYNNAKDNDDTWITVALNIENKYQKQKLEWERNQKKNQTTNKPIIVEPDYEVQTLDEKINILKEPIRKEHSNTKFNIYSNTSLSQIPNIEKYIDSSGPIDILQIATNLFSDKKVNPNNIFSKDFHDLLQYRFEVAQTFYDIGLTQIALEILFNNFKVEINEYTKSLFLAENKEDAVSVAKIAIANLYAERLKNEPKNSLLNKFLSYFTR